MQGRERFGHGLTPRHFAGLQELVPLGHVAMQIIEGACRQMLGTPKSLPFWQKYPFRRRGWLPGSPMPNLIFHLGRLGCIGLWLLVR